MAFAYITIPHRVQIILAFIAGIAAVALWNNATTYGSLNANISEEELDLRANGVIRTQREEIERLRTLLREASTCEVKPTPEAPAAKVQKTVRGCNTHDDCMGIDVVCRNSFCQELVDPVCACQGSGTDAYILCLSEQGQGNEARITPCNGRTCTNQPEPRCI